MGLLSYALFLVHLPMFWIVQNLLGTGIHPLLLLICGGTLSYFAALTLHYVVAEPLKTAKWKPLGTTVAILLSYCTIVAGAWFLPIQKADALEQTAREELIKGPELFKIQSGVTLPTPANGDPLRVAVVGDSIAGNMHEALYQFGPDGIESFDITQNECGIFDPDSARATDGSIVDSPSLCWGGKTSFAK